MDHSVTPSPTPSPGRRSSLSAPRLSTPSLSAPRLSAPSPSPYAVLVGFLLLLVAAFTVSYGVGHLTGPVAPDMHGVSHHGASRHDDPGMGDMGGMGQGDGH